APGGSRPFIGFGNLYFSLEQARHYGAAGSTRDNLPGRVEIRRLKSPSTGGRLAGLPPLPDTADEILAIATILHADPARDAFPGERANERAVAPAGLSNYRVVAFATHGLVPGDLDRLTQPALALTAPEVASVEGDGLLTMEKVLGLQLNADWVV